MGRYYADRLRSPGYDSVHRQCQDQAGCHVETDEGSNWKRPESIQSPSVYQRAMFTDDERRRMRVLPRPDARSWT